MSFDVTMVGLQKVVSSFGSLANKSEKIIKREMFRIASEFRNKIIQGMRDTPKSSEGRRRGRKMHYPSLPGNFPAIDSGRLVGSIRVEEIETGILLGSIQTEPPYPEYLDTSENPAMKRPWLTEVVPEWMEKIDFEARIVKALVEGL